MSGFTGTLSLTGTDAASFQIVGNNLETNGVVPPGAYNVSVVATQPGAAGSPLSRPFSITATGASSWATTVPPQAAAAGFNTNVWSEDFTNAATAATNSRVTNGFSLYAAIDNATPFTVSTTGTAAAIGNGNSGTAGANASPNGGILTYTLSTAAGSAAGKFTTIPAMGLNNSSSTLANLPLGQGRWWHGYFECYMQFNIDGQTVPNTPFFGSAGTQSYWPAFWSWNANGIGNWGAGSATGLNVQGAEIDFMEMFGTLLFANGQGNPRGFMASTMLPHAGGASGGFASATVDSNWHTYGMLWTSTGAGTGYWQPYLDNVKLGAGIVSPANMETSNQMAVFLIFSAGLGWPVNIDWIRVWQ